ncbi:DUF58 domain-containing protein [Acidicapsa ligni]|uniref:DUF58 domain-containing protein n=1 Tax=Acidicapsa ligni TaxID=542300 RepID=UPI0021DFA728|nr:DUF58 domain-containing protein [Acidicapsa ligni]
MLQPSLHPVSVQAACQPHSRFAFGLSIRVFTLLGLGFLWLIPGYYIPRLAYGMLLWDALVLIAALLDAWRLPAPASITVGRAWLSAPSLGNSVEIELSIRHQNSLALDCQLTDDLPVELIETPAIHKLRAYPRNAATLRYIVNPRERGDVEAGAIYLQYRSLLGLVSRWAIVPVSQPVRIYPELRTAEDQQLFLAKSRRIDLQLRQMRHRGLGREFESLREYRLGDDLRDVCWTASARRGDLVTRQYQAERSQSVWIVLDTGRLLRARVADDSAGRQSNHYTKLDYACSTAVALAQLALYSGDRVGLLGYGRRIQQQLLPNRGAGHLRQFLESLAQLRAEPSEADHLRATAILGRLQPRRSLILWITDLAESSMRPEVIDGAAQLLHRHVVLFVAMAQPEVAAIARAVPSNVEEMFRSAAAQEMASRRELLLARLRDQGAITIDTLPNQMTASVLNQYLSIKERAIL